MFPVSQKITHKLYKHPWYKRGYTRLQRGTEFYSLSEEEESCFLSDRETLKP